jgi:outer membrane protein OmpA-like peptidoglycan-associated protein
MKFSSRSCRVALALAVTLAGMIPTARAFCPEGKVCIALEHPDPLSLVNTAGFERPPKSPLHGPVEDLFAAASLIKFEGGRPANDEKSRQAISALAAEMRKLLAAGATRVSLRFGADPVLKGASAQKQANERAQSVAKALQSAGVPASAIQITAVAYVRRPPR